MKRKIHILCLFILIFVFAFGIYFCAEYYSNEYSENVLRLHVLANSDSPQDQALKLKVRDSVGIVISDLASNAQNAEETEKIVLNNISKIENAAVECIENEGYDYPVTVEVGEFYFPTKYYGEKALPAGQYDALRVIIGEGKGKNWWCVLFPPLCFSQGIAKVENMDIIESSKVNESNDENVDIKFKFVEIYQEAKNKIINFLFK